MTDKGILKNLWNNGYAQYAIKPQVNDAMNYDIDQALKDLRTYYREKIKWVGIEEIISNTLEKMNSEYKKVKDNPLSRKIDFILLPTERYELAQAILKVIDKEIK